MNANDLAVRLAKHLRELGFDAVASDPAASAEWLRTHPEAAKSWDNAEELAAFEAWVPRRLTHNEALREHLYRAFLAGRASVKP